MSPFISLFDNIFYLRYAVHIAHLRMTMKFDSFLRPGVHTSCTKITDFLNSDYRSYRQLTVKTVNRRHTFHFHKSTFFQILCQFRYLLRCQKNLYRNRIRKICNIHHDNRLFISDISCLQSTYTSTNNDLPHLTFDCADLDRILFNIPSVDYIWVIRTLQTTTIIAASLSECTAAPKGLSLI